MGIDKLAAKAKKLNPSEAPQPTLELAVRYLTAKAAAASGTGIGDDESAQAPPSKPTRVTGSAPAPGSLSPRTAISPAPRKPAPAQPTTISKADRALLEGVGEPRSRTPAQGFQTSSAAVQSKDGGGNTDILETEDFDDDFDDIPTSGSSGMEMAVAPKSSFGVGLASASVGGGDSGGGGGVPLSTSIAASLKELLFARQGGRQPASWIQGFFFSPHLGLEYGLVQTDGGPCGVLAAVQAHIIKHLAGKTGGHPAGITREQKQAALFKGLAGALWNARGKASVAVVGCGSNNNDGNWKTTVGLDLDELLRSVRIYRAGSLEAGPDTRGSFSAKFEHLRVYERGELSGYGYTTA